MSGKNTFRYFGYGSNMLTERIHLKNPTAKFVCVGKLPNYRFGFERPVALKSFGSIATVRPGTESDHVMGCVWEIDADQVGNLDKQETHYKAIQVDVVLEDGSTTRCRTYEIDCDVHHDEDQPHPFYKKICVSGAKQHNLPEEYISFLEKFEDNKDEKQLDYYKALIPVLQKL